MGHGGFGVSVSNVGKLPPRKFLVNSTTSRGHSGGANVKGHSGGAGSRGRSEKASWAGPAETKESRTGPTGATESRTL